MVESILKCIYIDGEKLKYGELIKYLKVLDRSSFNKALDELKYRKLISKDRSGRFIKSNRDDIYTGVYEGSRRGFGFLLLKDERDIFIPRVNLKGAMDGDKVLIKVYEDKSTESRKVGEVIYIIERNKKEIIGEYQHSKSFGFVVPHNYNINYDIYIPKKYRNKAKNGDIVCVSIYKYPKDFKKPEGIVTEVIGNKNSKDIYLKILMRKYGLKSEFKNDVLRELTKLNKKITDRDLKVRRDLRELPIITIDGSDAKDLDDAVYLEKVGDNYKLGVHIADVSHYVKYGTSLDKEAYRRGTSVYLINKVVPMLPPELSDDLCSLNENTDKLTLSCEMIIDKNGKVISYDIFESIIRTKYRMTYDGVQDILDGIQNKYDDIKDMIFNMRDLALILSNKRELRGAINFDFSECKISLDDNNNVIDIKPFERKFSHRIIEEFMLLCNETVAEHMYFLSHPFPYRIHEEPNMEKIDELSYILHNMDYSLKVRDKIYSNEIQKVLNHFKGRDEEMFLSKLILRSMSKARYLKECLGHFGLSTKYYCHFTSPIRRYPDLVAHRIIKLLLHKGISEDMDRKLSEEVSSCCENSSIKEREAEECERELYERKRCEFMEDKIGEEYTGIISSITDFGIFVELPNTIRGLVHINDMEGEYQYDERNMSLVKVGETHVFKIGMKVNVYVLNVILDENEIYFGMCEEE